jgi:glyoxylase-like metal-dependent hydrolase (beta-lactamase superfamily II)
MTHLHKDHAGGVSQDKQRSRLSFPGATYYVQQKEFAFALEKGMPSFIPEELQALENAAKVVWLNDDEGLIDEYIRYKVTGAHSPLHQVFWIKENEEIIFLVVMTLRNYNK